MIEILRVQNSEYVRYSQQDCFQFILLIIDIIGQRHNEILQFFKLYNKYECRKCNNAIKRKDFIIFSEDTACEFCYGNMEMQYISIPKCIITTNLNKNHLKIKTVD
jgi:hypothetical protein